MLPQLESGERCHSLVCEHSLGGDLEREGEKGGRRHAGRWGGEGREGRGKGQERREEGGMLFTPKLWMKMKDLL